MHLLNFRFIYPSERDRIPRWLLDELLLRAHAAGRLAAAADQGLPRPPVLARRLQDRRHGVGVRRRGRPGDPGPAEMSHGEMPAIADRRPTDAARRGDRRRPCHAGGQGPLARHAWRRSPQAPTCCACAAISPIIGTVPEAEALAEDLRACSIPVLAVLGNHDHHCGAPRRSSRCCAHAGVKFLEDEVHDGRRRRLRRRQGLLRRLRRPHARRVRRARDQGVRAGGGRRGAPAGARAEDARDRAHRGRAALRADRRDGRRRARGDLPVSRLLAAGRDHRPLRRACAVFHGHAHHGSYEGRTRRGTPVFNVAATVEKPDGKAYALIEV